MRIKILEVDQWTSTGDVEDYTLEDFSLEKITGGDSETSRRLGIGHDSIREVEEDGTPPMARVWYRPGPDGKLKRWKATYDSSD